MSAAPPTEVVLALVDAHRTFLAFVERRVGDRQIAEDILQDAFARGLERIETLREGESVVAWFYRSLRNAVVDHYRRNDSKRRALEALAAELDGEASAEGELASVVCGCVMRLADTLDPSYAEALRRIELDGIPVKSFAEEKGITASNAGVRVFRARQALRERVATACGTCAEHGCLDCTCG